MGDEMEDNLVLCGANSYEEKYYLNPVYEVLPQQVKDELKILCVLFVNEVGGIIILEFNEEGDLRIVVTRNDDDFFYDDIESELKVRKLQRENEELFSMLERYFRVMNGLEDIDLSELDDEEE